MRTFRFFSIFAVLAFAAVSASAQSIRTDYDRSYNFSKLKTFAFREQRREANSPLVANPLVDERIRRDIETQLSASGYQKDTTGRPDFVIAYYVSAAERTRLKDNSMYGAFGRLRRLDIQQESFVQGTLIVDFVDHSTNKLVWRGYASGNADPKKSEKHLFEAIEKLVKEFIKDGRAINK